ncbi:MAG: DUF1588 domain-containing protein [Myxococcales bacterium]|nr:DUF1588 domain-containing protein [Myxococcales bacterium]
MKIFDRMLAAAVPALLGAALGCTDDQGSTPDDDVGDVDVGTTDAGTADTGTTDADTGDTGEPEEPSGNALDQNQLFVCNGEPAMPPADIRLLDRFEWTRNVGSWYGTDLDRNPLYARPEHRYSSYYRDEAMDASILSLYLDVVPEAGLAWTAPYSYSANAIRTVFDDPETKCFFDDVDPAPECVRYFVGRLLERGSIFRPAEEVQIDALYDLAQDALADEAGIDDRSATILKIGGAAWMSADALYRSEIGEGPVDEYGRVRLSDHELAAAIAYSLARSAPGAPAVRRKHQYYSKGDVDGYPAGFWQAAADGTISDPAVIAALVEAHIGGIDDVRQDLFLSRADERSWDNRGEYWMSAGLVAFFREWLGYGDLALQPPKAEIDATAGWTGFAVQASYQNQVDPFYGYENSFVEHLDDMIARIIVDDSDVFATLLSSRMFYTPATAGYQEGETSIWKNTAEMNRAYNVQGVTPQTREARWIELPASERAGVLTHPAWLGAHSLSFENDPNLVHRGKWVRESLLCQDVPDLPINVDAALSDESKSESARTRISTQLDNDPYCAGCHALMNPLGYPFEIYNHAGFLRIEDHGTAPNGSSNLINMPDPSLEGPVSSAVDMSERFAASDYTKRCFIRQTFRYFVGREETMADACTMAALEQAYDDSGGSFVALLVALYTSDSFQTRVQE